MNLVEQLIKQDAKKATELETGTFPSKRMARILGKDGETVDITIKAIESRRISDISGYQYDKKGRFDISKTYDARLMACVEGCVDPDLRNKDLQQHFECRSAKELAEKLFQMEAADIADAIMALSGVNDEEDEDNVKN